MKKITLLKGEGVNQHTLYGNFADIKTVEEYQKINLKTVCMLKHEKPDGSFSNEHKALEIEKGNWVMGKQVEYNPFSKQITDIWD